MKHEKMTCCRGSMKIAGDFFVPDGAGPFPLVIYSHGFGYNYEEISMSGLARAGIAACRFDFCGGSPHSRSSGSMRNMSVLTEADDLEAVLDYCRSDDRFDRGNIFLAGNSQGGYVSAIAGIRRQEDIRGLFLLSPAFIIADFRKLFLDGKRPEGTFRFGGMLLGAGYVTDAEAWPLFDHLPELRLPVMIYHGTADEMAPIRYSEKAVELLPNAELMRIPGGGHMLAGHASVIEKDMIKRIRGGM